MFSFKFSYLDVRLVGGAGFFGGLLIAKLWEPALNFDWYWYGIVLIALIVKPAITFFKQW